MSRIISSRPVLGCDDLVRKVRRAGLPMSYARVLSRLAADSGQSSAEIAWWDGWSSFTVHDILLECEKAGLARWKQDGPGTAWLWELA